ncbi:multicopper oxidase family protein [Elioraea sp. Yellowstone]|jgi:FtsP/CotA-like multicopper oxidase with cupredoxin domain|uniref:multicopper oxidase family protein n=1 Tax=Elioraea sp. Yellowstone TaxID=2592070 RepID=UPI0011516414|nr:multicopper oxidase family protein [Elioraea sp. Yellowstone]TQF85225.1 multicopper oxidase family protein [Elioraea sp. Yellowstone]
MAPTPFFSGLGRRAFLHAASVSSFVAAGLSTAARAQGSARADATIRLKAHPSRVALVGASHPATDVWTYGDSVPGPEIRVRQASRLRVEFENQLPQETTIHWHGVRVPNAMDGVPHLTQPPVPPGGTFLYEFDVPDAGTFWYHPHARSAEQVGRGLYGALIVEEDDPDALPCNRDVTWVLDDWRLMSDASVSADFGSLRDLTHSGRIGNTVTVNGRVTESFEVHSGERLRLRLINVANARIFGLVFEDHEPVVVAIDGHPTEPHSPEGGRIVLGPGMRIDLVLDLNGDPGSQTRVLDTYYERAAYRLLDLTYASSPRRDRTWETPPRPLPPNPLSEPDLLTAEHHEVMLGGGMMGRMTHAMVDGQRFDARELFRRGIAWSINGIAVPQDRHAHEPLAVLRRLASYVLTIRNDTAWPHPMHLHGLAFRVIARNGRATPRREWQDTVLVPSWSSADIAFVADNPGNWMFHCHILEHQAAGMMATLRVS